MQTDTYLFINSATPDTRVRLEAADLASVRLDRHANFCRQIGSDPDDDVGHATRRRRLPPLPLVIAIPGK